MKSLFLFFVFTTFSLFSFSQSRFRILEYNVENFFDTAHDSLKSDQDFTPSGTHHWTRSKYWQKLIHLSQVISAAGEEQLPDLVALCEVENDSALIYLTQRSPLRVAGYRYVMTHSPDERGIDVALLYQRATFRPLQIQEIGIDTEHLHQRPTRNILHVTGLVQTGDTLDVLVCHFPSRRNGQKESDGFRQAVAQVLKQKVDSIQESRQDPRMVITGDFNDEPTNASIRQVLQAGSYQEPVSGKRLYDLMAGKKPGTYKYQGEWNTLDQFIVNGNLLRKNPGHFQIQASDVQVFQPSFLLEEDRKYGGMKPFRTYNGLRYQGGYSDHLPVIGDFRW